METYSDRLKAICDRLGISQRELGRRAHLTNETDVGVIVHRLKTDPSSSVPTEVTVALAKAGGVSIEWLATGKGDPMAVEETHQVSPDEGITPLLPTLGRVPNAASLFATAKKLEPDVPDWAWDHTRMLPPVVAGPPTARSIAALAKYVMEFEPPPDRKK